MKSLRIAVATVLCSAVLGATAAPVLARDAVSFSFNIGDVRMGYSDGYWDNQHRWHNWRSSREAREFRRLHSDRYVNERHTRLRNAGWRDEDRDGIPNRFDRDRDNDGVPNRYDNHPDNSRRN
jgi:hypothetical protein